MHDVIYVAIFVHCEWKTFQFSRNFKNCAFNQIWPNIPDQQDNAI